MSLGSPSSLPSLGVQVIGVLQGCPSGSCARGARVWGHSVAFGIFRTISRGWAVVRGEEESGRACLFLGE